MNGLKRSACQLADFFPNSNFDQEKQGFYNDLTLAPAAVLLTHKRVILTGKPA
jgi:hypothetical protein